MFLFFIKHLQFEIYSACVFVIRCELHPFVIHFALKIVSSGAGFADLYGHNGDVVTVWDGEVVQVEPSGCREILDGIGVTTTAINKDLFLVTTLRIPELLEVRGEWKAFCHKVLFSDGFWLPVSNVSEGQKDAGGDCGPLVAVGVFGAKCSEIVSVKLTTAIKVGNV